MKESVECSRCGLTTTYTNAVELQLWQDRPGCPACYKTGKGEGGKVEPSTQREAPESFAALAKWYDSELSALTHLVLLGVITHQERESIAADLGSALRDMAGLDPQ